MISSVHFKMKSYFGIINEPRTLCDACSKQDTAFCRCSNIRVLDDDTYQDIDPRLDLANHSPTGFSWGYEGNCPAQSALAILADYYDDEFALKYYQEFKRAYISRYNQTKMFELSGNTIDFWRAVNRFS